MDKQSRYTAQEMRQTAEMDFYVTKLGLDDGPNLTDGIRSMLCQAADTEDELAKLNESKNRWMQYQETAAGERNACIDELRKKDAEIAQLKTRLETVVKECEKISKEKFRMNEVLAAKGILNRILRTARGEGSTNM